MVPPLMTQNTIYEAIDHTCELFNDKNRFEHVWNLRRATAQDFKTHSCNDGNTVVGVVDETRLYGVVAYPVDGENGGAGGVLTTFYIAYSTWDGRFLYLDDPGNQASSSSSSSSDSTAEELMLLLRHTLADIAIRFHCARFTWQHQETESSSSQLTYPGNAQPENLHGWLTLHWSAEAIRGFLQAQVDDDGSNELMQLQCTSEGLLDNHLIRETIKKCLEKQTHAKLNLTLSCAENVNDIGRLVQGLADFEHEPDAVHVTADHYLRDGFEGDRPYFQCILLNHIGDDGTVYTCGMAFCYIGFKLSDGLFLYLEDLFIEEAYRGRGLGTAVMKALATIGYSLRCSRLVWQALDWNTPALTFYNKLGAKVQEGLLTTRFARDTLKTFVANYQAAP